jgi:hypothetical protein
MKTTKSDCDCEAILNSTPRNDVKSKEICSFVKKNLTLNRPDSSELKPSNLRKKQKLFFA